MRSFDEFFTKTPSENRREREEIPVESPRKENPVSLDLENMNGTDLICALLSRFIDNETQLCFLADFLTDVDNLKMVKEMRKLLSSPAETIKMVDSYRGISTDELDGYANQFESKLKGDVVRAQQNKLWKEGGNIIDLGRSDDEIIGNIDSMLVSVDVSNLKSSAANYKENILTNALDAILACLKTRDTMNLVSFSDKLKYVKEMLKNFEKGQLPQGIDFRKYRPPAEAGLMQSHTLSTKGWIEKEVTDFLRDQYGSINVAYCDAQDSDIRRFEDDSNILLVSDDESSPYHWSRNPAFTKIETEDGIWFWRNEVDHANAILKADMAKSGTETKSKADILVELANASTVVDSVRFNGALTQVITNDDSMCHFVCVYKRGKSKVDEILSNTDRIHITSSELASSLRSHEFRTFTLSDGYTVLVIPIETWKRSIAFRRNKSVIGHRAWAGCRRVQDNPFALWGAMTSLGYTLKYFEFLRGTTSDAPDPGEYWTNIFTNMANGVYDKLYGLKYNSAYNSKIIEMYAPAIFTGGLFVHPEVSKTGKMLLTESSKYADYTVGGKLTLDMFMSSIENDHTTDDSNAHLFFNGDDSSDSQFDSLYEGGYDDLHDDDLVSALDEALTGDPHGS